MRRAQHEQGFTLAEVLIATAILAIVTSLVYGSFARTFQVTELVGRVQERNHSVQVALERVSRELSMAFVYDCREIDTPTGERRYWTVFKLKDEGGFDKVTFAAFAHQRLVRDANESDQCELAYYAEPDPDERDKMNLMRREKVRIDGQPDEGGRAQVLCHDIKAFQLEAWDANKGEWVDEWDCTQIERQNLLPRMVRIKLTVLNEYGDETAFTTVTRIFTNKPLSAWIKASQ